MDVLEMVHIGLMVVGLAVSAFVGWISLVIKANQATVRADLLANQNDMRQDMDEKHSENRQGLAVHIAEDRVNFNNIAHSLRRIESVIDRQERDAKE